MTKPTQDKETLREAVARAMYESRDNYIPWGHITQKWRRFWYEQADAAIATMFERLRKLPNEVADDIAKKHFVSFEVAKLIGRDIATAFQQENSDVTTDR